MLRIKTFQGGFDRNLSYIVYDTKTKDATIIDISINPRTLLKFILKNKLKLDYAIIMHSHFDHLSGYNFYKTNKIKLLAHESFKNEVDQRLKDQEEIKLGNYALKVIHTPGHIYDSICILINNKLFTSDTLFIVGCGRCDLSGSDIKAMYNSLYNKLLKLPEKTVIYPGHNYGNKLTATLKELKQTNSYLKAKSKEEFLYIRKSF